MNRSTHPSRSELAFERRWGHPLIGFARFLASAGFWISHFVIVAGVGTALLLTSFDATIHHTTATIATMAFGVVWAWHVCSPLQGGSPDAAVDQRRKDEECRIGIERRLRT